ncbi:hypothetical protein INR49_009987 [Caranx melampygus]|nr:hypothetical protein INR49_009987 [Caranx melampygus]
MSSRGSGGRTNGTLPQTKICQFKLVLLGDMAVGKSSLVLRFVKGQFDEFQETTIGAAFLAQSVCLDDTTVKFEIWDTAGQERYHSLAPMYYRGAQAAIVVFDITKPETFERAKAWVKELQRQASPNIVIALAGNKADLAEKRLVEYEEAQTYAEDTGLLFMETSAKTAMNVNELFLAIGERLLPLHKKDAKNRHPEPDTRGATSGRQPAGPGRPFHPSLLRWELDPHPPPPTSIPPSTPPQPVDHPVSFNQTTYRRGPDAPTPPPSILLSEQTENQKERIKRKEKMKQRWRDEAQRFNICVSRPTTESLHLEKLSGRCSEERSYTQSDSGRPVLVFSTNCEFSLVFTLPCNVCSHSPG